MRKMKTTMSKSKSKNKLLNRVFAILFFIYSLALFYYQGYGVGSVLKPLADASHQPLLVIVFFSITPIGIGFTIILFGLLKEIWKHSLDFTFNHNWKWIFASIILFMVFILLNIWYWIFEGLPNWLPNQGWQTTIIEYFFGLVAVDTCILSLMLGILFLTNSDPKKSPSYKIILIGVLLYQIVCFSGYLIDAATNIAGLESPFAVERYRNFLGYTIFQPWFWLDMTSQTVTFIGALWLLRNNTNIKKLIIIFIILFIVFFVLSGPFLLGYTSNSL